MQDKDIKIYVNGKECKDLPKTLIEFARKMQEIMADEDDKVVM